MFCMKFDKQGDFFNKKWWAGADKKFTRRRQGELLVQEKIYSHFFCTSKRNGRKKKAPRTPTSKAWFFSGIRFIYCSSLRFALFVDFHPQARRNKYMNVNFKRTIWFLLHGNGFYWKNSEGRFLGDGLLLYWMVYDDF